MKAPKNIRQPSAINQTLEMLLNGAAMGRNFTANPEKRMTAIKLSTVGCNNQRGHACLHPALYAIVNTTYTV